jgi:hypothetical protein
MISPAIVYLKNFAEYQVEFKIHRYVISLNLCFKQFPPRYYSSNFSVITLVGVSHLKYGRTEPFVCRSDYSNLHLAFICPIVSQLYHRRYSRIYDHLYYTSRTYTRCLFFC